MRWFPILTLKLVKSFFPRVKTSGHLPQKIAQVPFYRLHEKSQSHLLYSVFNHFSKFQIFEDFFSHAYKRIWKIQNSQKGSFWMNFHSNWSKLVIFDMTCIPAAPYTIIKNKSRIAKLSLNIYSHQL